MVHQAGSDCDAASVGDHSLEVVRSRTVTLVICGHQIENKTGSIGDRKPIRDRIRDR
jgi:hypothetical protein